MGYRSTMFVKINKEDKELFEDALKQASVVEPGFTEYFIPESEEDFDDEYLRYTASDLKRYSSYPAVKIINRFINDYDGKHLRAMIAVGEDDATESFGSPMELDMYTTSEIEW